ncbi:hypothetical protein AAUPMC_09663 [Pasteurella multocida subsp. multocida str. Anand1_cattle]|nr:hypothetical protein AAUPMC_09663 [Pasteurella multocida subsp. multocida str. Anand1_cattle]
MVRIPFPKKVWLFIAPMSPNGMPNNTASKIALKQSSRVGGKTVWIMAFSESPPLYVMPKSPCSK